MKIIRSKRNSQLTELVGCFCQDMETVTSPLHFLPVFIVWCSFCTDMLHWLWTTVHFLCNFTTERKRKFLLIFYTYKSLSFVPSSSFCLQCPGRKATIANCRTTVDTSGKCVLSCLDVCTCLRAKRNTSTMDSWYSVWLAQLGRVWNRRQQRA